MKALALSNNDVAVIAWTFDHKIDGCLGFAVYRIDVNDGKETCLPALATFPNQEATPGRTTAQDPVQKFWWKDVYAPRGGLYQYRVVPMGGVPGNPAPLPVAPLVTNAVQLTPDRGIFSAYFNRGILATQATAKQLATDGGVDAATLDRHIGVAGDPLRTDLAGQMPEALLSLLNAAKADGGDCYAALYELDDAELIDALKTRPANTHVILSNLRGKTTEDEDKAARDALAAAHVDKTDRILAGGHIGHNKFMVQDSGGPVAVLFGSTNWTAHGLCAQTNNTLIARSPRVAGTYRAYWDRLKADTEAAGGDAGRLQAAPLRQANAAAHDPLQLEDGSATAQVWFSPNTPHARTRDPGEATPPDLAEVFDLIGRAQDAILFLAFEPGSPSIVEAIANAQRARPGLFVRGALTDLNAAHDFQVTLNGQPEVRHQRGDPPESEDPRVIAAGGVEDNIGVWERELNKAGYAVIHDKIIVIDPFSANCAVVTGSHNLGFEASYNNDENLVIVRGHRALAEAYSTHVLDVYDHYSWRYWLQQKKDAAWTFLDPTDAWQARYFGDDGRIASPELAFWLGAAP